MQHLLDRYLKDQQLDTLHNVPHQQDLRKTSYMSLLEYLAFLYQGGSQGLETELPRQTWEPSVLDCNQTVPIMNPLDILPSKITVKFEL